jgi:oxygen-dependent protoporphyrinogen oxidase
MSKTIIVGGGIAGLATAFALHERGCEFVLVESAPRWGGKIVTAQEQGFTVEGGPDSFITQKAGGLELCRKLGLEDQLVGSNSGEAAKTYIYSRGRLQAMPEGMMLMAPTMILPFLRSRLITWRGKLRMGMEIFIPRKRGNEDESLAAFVRRRLGNELLNKIAGPLMGGIHAADPERLSLRSTFPMFIEMERKHRSLTLAMMKRKKQPATHSAAPPGAKRPSMFMTLRGGLEQLTETLVARLPQSSLRANCGVTVVRREGNRYRVELNDGSSVIADDIVFATPSYITADLLRPVDATLADQLSAIRYVSTATVSLGFMRADIAHPLIGAGFIVPHSEGRQITACSWSSAKFNHRAPEDCVLLRVFIGGALSEALAEQDEATLIRIAREELRVILGIDATPVLVKAYRWYKANPQYDLGHEERLTEIERTLASLPGLHIVGAAYRGAGLPDCIQSGTRAAQAIRARWERCLSSEVATQCIES